MLSEQQIKSVLTEMSFDGRYYCYRATDPNIWNRLDEIAPYVREFKHQLRSFSCTGLSQAGKDLLEK